MGDEQMTQRQKENSVLDVQNLTKSMTMVERDGNEVLKNIKLYDE